MSGKRYTEEFKIQAVKQVTKHGHTLNSTAERLGVSYKSLCEWVKKYEKPATNAKPSGDSYGEVTLATGEKVEITQSILDSMELGYAITLHKGIIIALQNGKL